MCDGFIEFSSRFSRENGERIGGRVCRNLITHASSSSFNSRLLIFHMSQQIFGIFCYFIRRYFHQRLNYDFFLCDNGFEAIFSLPMVRARSFNGFSKVNICDFPKTFALITCREAWNCIEFHGMSKPQKFKQSEEKVGKFTSTLRSGRN
jgi:hypothetical protein